MSGYYEGNYGELLEREVLESQAYEKELAADEQDHAAEQQADRLARHTGWDRYAAELEDTLEDIRLRKAANQQEGNTP